MRGGLSPEQLPAVVTLSRIARHGSFTRAAVELGVSASALSQTIRSLEKHVGIRLLNRTTRSVGLTEAGSRFLERVGPALQLLTTAFEELDEQRATPAGTLRLNLASAAADFLVAPVLAEFGRVCPDVTLDMTVEDGLADLIAGGFDAGIRIGEQLAQNMVAVPVGPPLRMAVVGSPAYFRYHSKPLVPADLAQHACIRYRFSTSGGIYRWEFTQDGRDFAMDVNGGLVTTDSSMMINAARDGLGISCVLDLSVRADLASGSLVRVLEEYCPPFPGFYLYYPHRTHMPLKLRSFIEILQRHWSTKPRARRKSQRVLSIHLRPSTWVKGNGT